jgi:CubicO group peptidase (beta-lactamase class C family)
MRFTPRRLLLPLALLAATSTACRAPSGSASPAVASARAVYPGTEWESIGDVGAAGWSAEGLQAVRAKLSTLATTGFMAVQRGRVLMQYGNVDTVTYLASVRKSVLSMLVGIYQERGRINLDRTLAQMGIDDHGGLTDREKEATFRHLLEARSGVYHAASNAGDDLASAPPRGSQRAGSYYLYSNWDFNAAGEVFERQAGVGIFDALERDIVIPIGMRDFNRAQHRKTGDSTASRYLAYHMHFSTRDMARIGYLMLREGNWNGRQVVPRDWVRESTRAHTPVGEMNPAPRREGPWGYGYLWWVWDGKDNTGPYAGAYTGLGAVGQHITVLPKLDLVVVHKTAPRPGANVSHTQFRDVLAFLLSARR